MPGLAPARYSVSRRIVGLPAFAQPLRRGGVSRPAPPLPLPVVPTCGGGGGEECDPPIANDAAPPPRWAAKEHAADSLVVAFGHRGASRVVAGTAVRHKLDVSSLEDVAVMAHPGSAHHPDPSLIEAFSEIAQHR